MVHEQLIFSQVDPATEELDGHTIEPTATLLIHIQPLPLVKESFDDAWRASNGALDTLLADDEPLAERLPSKLPESEENAIEPDLLPTKTLPVSESLQESPDGESEPLDESLAAGLLLADVTLETPTMADSSLVMPTLPLPKPASPRDDLTFTNDDGAKLLLEDVPIKVNLDQGVEQSVSDVIIEKEEVQAKMPDFGPIFDKLKVGPASPFDHGFVAVANVDADDGDDFEKKDDGIEISAEWPTDLQSAPEDLALAAPASVETASVEPNLGDLRRALEKCKEDGYLREAESFCESFFKKEFRF